MNKTQYTVAPEDVGQRLDLFLTLKHPSLTRSQIQRLIEEGLVNVNYKLAKASHKIREGDDIEISIPEPDAIEALPEPIPLEILYEDSEVVVINKPIHQIGGAAIALLAGVVRSWQGSYGLA
ncbi:MAG: rluD 2 [Deltaproteobacteria bacterium]|nr:rluD 2 [Deltaproteobacteria bacterium]